MNTFDLSEGAVWKLAHDFFRIIPNGTLVSAAKRYGVSATAISKKIERLEDWLGFSLITRQYGRPFVLTPAGKRLYQEASEFSKRLAHLRKEEAKGGIEHDSQQLATLTWEAAELSIQLVAVTDALRRMTT